MKVILQSLLWFRSTVPLEGWILINWYIFILFNETKNKFHFIFLFTWECSGFVTCQVNVILFFDELFLTKIIFLSRVNNGISPRFILSLDREASLNKINSIELKLFWKQSVLQKYLIGQEPQVIFRDFLHFTCYSNILELFLVIANTFKSNHTCFFIVDFEFDISLMMQQILK